MITKSMEPSKRRLWLAALMPPMYSVAVMPIYLGTTIAVADTGVMHWGVFATFVSAAVLILAWMNFSNDVFDAETGIDENEPTSLVNLTGSKSLIFWISNVFLILGIAGVVAIARWQQDFTVLGLVFLGCFLGYTYQGPPFRLGYQGLGEILCFLCFGPIAVAAAYYSQSQTWSLPSLGAATLLGITTSLILFCSHFHQVEDDLAAGKRSPVARLGTARAAQLLRWCSYGVFVLVGLLILLGTLPLGTLLIFASLPFAVKLSRHVGRYHNQPAQVRNCKFLAVQLHFWSGILLGVGFLLSGG
jgi:2-carboxy-1,4-naphthoquinone phytyltransferase